MLDENAPPGHLLIAFPNSPEVNLSTCTVHVYSYLMEISEWYNMDAKVQILI